MATRPAESRTPALIALISGAALILGSILAWVTVEVLTFSETASGLDVDDGWITLVCGLVALVMGGMAFAGKTKPKMQGILTLIAGLIATGVGVIDYMDVQDAANQIPALPEGFGEASASTGIGLYLVLVAGVGTIVAGIMFLRARGASTTTDLPPAADTTTTTGGTPTV